MFRALKTSAFCPKGCRLGLCLKFNCFGKFEQILFSVSVFGSGENECQLGGSHQQYPSVRGGSRLSPSKDRLGAEGPRHLFCFCSSAGLALRYRWRWQEMGLMLGAVTVSLACATSSFALSNWNISSCFADCSGFSLPAVLAFCVLLSCLLAVMAGGVYRLCLQLLEAAWLPGSREVWDSCQALRPSARWLFA